MRSWSQALESKKLDVAWMSGGRRCGTEIRQAPADAGSHSDAASAVPPPVSLEGLILKISNSQLKIGTTRGDGDQAKLGYAARYAPGNVDVVVKRFKHPFSVQDYDKQGQWPPELFKTVQFYVCQLIGYVEDLSRHA